MAWKNNDDGPPAGEKCDVCGQASAPHEASVNYNKEGDFVLIHIACYPKDATLKKK